MSKSIQQASRDLSAGIRRILEETGREFSAEMVKRTSGPTSPESLSLRTGRLQRSVTKFVVTGAKTTREVFGGATIGLTLKTAKIGLPSLGFFQLRVGSPFAPFYAVLHEFGTATFPARLGFKKTYFKHVTRMEEKLRRLLRENATVRV